MPFDARAELKALGLAHRADDILSLAREGIALHSSPASVEFPLGVSRFGGRPDLPASIRWPKRGEKALQFLCQINLIELQAACPHELLPASGWLYFFYDGEVWGYDPAHRDGFQVYYHDGTVTDLKRADAPPPRPRTIIFGLIKKLETVREYNSCGIQFKPSVNFPYWDSYAVERLGFTEDESDRYVDFLDAWLARDDHTTHMMLMHPDPVQNDPFHECEMVAQGMQNATPEEAYSETVKQAAQEWQLLLQLRCDDNTGMNWGDGGDLFFCIRHADLRDRRFDKIWMSLQCH